MTIWREVVPDTLLHRQLAAYAAASSCSCICRYADQHSQHPAFNQRINFWVAAVTTSLIHCKRDEFFCRQLHFLQWVDVDVDENYCMHVYHIPNLYVYSNLYVATATNATCCLIQQLIIWQEKASVQWRLSHCRQPGISFSY